jgi:hypothetical protein
MDLDINCSQLSLRSSFNHQTTMNNNIPQSYFDRIKKTFTKNFCCHGIILSSSSCFKCFRYFIPTKTKCEF